MTSRYNNRELSWLEFNSRVLSEAGNTDLPLFERVRFLSIASKNLDEFYMVRVAGVYAQLKEKIKHETIDGLSPKEQLKKIKNKSSELLKKSNFGTFWQKNKYACRALAFSTLCPTVWIRNVSRRACFLIPCCG